MRSLLSHSIAIGCILIRKEDKTRHCRSSGKFIIDIHADFPLIAIVFQLKIAHLIKINPKKRKRR